MEIYQIEIQAEANQATALWVTFLNPELIKGKDHKNPTYYNHMTSVHFLKGGTQIRKINGDHLDP
jgi:hypothetical protein